MKEDAIDQTVWKNCLRRGYGLVEKQAMQFVCFFDSVMSLSLEAQAGVR